MPFIQESWLRVISFVIFLLLVAPGNALPKKKATSSTTTSTTVSDTAGGSINITTATDGSTIMDKTVTIK